MSKPVKMAMSAKCSDLFSASFDNAEGVEVISYHGYVPDWFPGQHYGDYVSFEIELATGKILNWKAPTAADLKAMKEGE